MSKPEPARAMHDLPPESSRHLESNVEPKPPVGKSSKWYPYLFNEKVRADQAFSWAQTLYGTLAFDDKVIANKGKGTIEFYDVMMDSDSILSALIETRISAVAGLETEVVAAGKEDDELAQQQAALIRFAFDRLDDFEDILDHILGACRVGYSVTEIIWEQVEWEGRTVMVPADLNAVKPTLFKFDANYDLRLFAGTGELQGELCEPYKFLVHSFGKRYKSPYGVSLLRACYWPWWFKHHGLKYWLQAAERGAVITPVGYYTEDATPDEISQLEDAMKRFLGNKYLALQEGTKVDFPHIKIAPEFADKLRSAMNEEMLYRVLGATLSSATAGTGSRALGEVHDKRLQERVESDAKALMNTINRLVKWIVNFNWIGVEMYPEWGLKYEQLVDMKVMGATLRTAADLGIPVSLKDAAGLLQLPMAEEGEPIIQPPTAQSALEPPPADGEEEEPEEPEEPEDEDNTAMIASGAVLLSRVDENFEKMDLLLAGALKASVPVVGDMQDEAEDWVNTFDSIEAAITMASTYEPDMEPLAELMMESGYLSMLHGLHQVFELPKVRDNLSVGAIWRRFKTAFGKTIAATYEPVPPEEAIAMFEDRGVLTRAEFELLEAAERRNTLTAAGMTRDTIRGAMRDSLLRALRDGETLHAFSERVGNIVMSPAHAETIFRANVMTAYNNGHAEGMYRPELARMIPAMQFFAVSDDRTTDICIERNGMIYTREEMTTLDIMPPCHFRCRSTTVPIFVDEWDGRSAGTPSIRSTDGFGRWEPILR